MIPKVIHYCWFGKNPKSEIITQCIASWRQYCPDWEIIEWNESNCDYLSIPFAQEAYDAQKWAFVSDVIRLKAVYEYGGVYFDTDVELTQSLDSYLQHNAFFVFESERSINTGVGFGAVKGHPSVLKMLDCFLDQHFCVNGKYNLTPCPAKNTEALKETYPQFQRNGKSQLFDSIYILSQQEYMSFAKHYGDASWVNQTHRRQSVYKDTKLKKILRKPEVFDWIEVHFGKRTVNCYTFIAYDLMEMGPMYYLNRIVFGKRKGRK